MTKENRLLKRVRRTAAAIAALGALLAGGAAAHEVRFIASDGDNANLCTRDAPCRTLNGGINRTPPGGELIVLDSGDFGGGASIDESITISAVGVSAAVGGTIAIDGGATVVLRGLHLNGAAASGDGITIGFASQVYIDDCEIQGFAGSGIAAVTTSDPHVFISNSVVRDNGGDGLVFTNEIAAGRLVIDNSRFERNGDDGLDLRAREVSVTNSRLSGNGDAGVEQSFGQTNFTRTSSEHNGGDGFLLQSSGQMTLEQSVARGNDFGLRVNDLGTARVSGSVMTNNTFGISAEAGATLLTRENNTVSGNTTDTSGTLTPLGGT